MVRRIPGYWFVEEIEIRPFGGSGAYGDVFGETFTARGNVDSRRVLVRGAEGENVVGESTIHLPPHLDDGSDTLDAIPEQSEVTYRGRPGVVLTVKPITARGQVMYIEVTTT